MKIAFTGGGTGGHFYPHIAVAEAIEVLCKERTLIEPELYYIGPPAFDPVTLQEHDITYRPSPAGKLRTYPSLLNITDMVKTFFGVIASIFQLFVLYPDVVFSTGGYAAFPTLWAARILAIPVVIYDADATPGRVSLWSAKFARWIGIAHTEAAERYPARIRDKIARVGHPIRAEIVHPAKEGGYEFLKLDESAPVLFIMGGSQGAVAINNTILDSLPELLKDYNIVHQAGSANQQDVVLISSVVLKGSEYQDRYKVFGLLNTLALRMAAGVSSLVIARAGSGTIFEIASWGIPSILVPLPMEVSRDQTENAFSYARTGAAEVIEQQNLTPHVLVAEVHRIMNDKELRQKMSDAAQSFAKPDAARKIASVLLEIAISHEPV